MTHYKETKRNIENILGIKAKNIMAQAENMAEKPISACCIAGEKYTIYLFKTSEIEYDVRENGDDYTVYDSVLYYAVETGSRLPVSWPHSCRGQRYDLKCVGYNYRIKSTIIEEDTPQTHTDREIMWALYNCSHMGHFEEASLFD